MSIVEHLRKMWYKGHETDIYDPHEFDELFKMEEQDDPLFGRQIKPIQKIVRGNMSKETNKENIIVMDHPKISPQSEVIVIEPRSFDEALEIIEELRCRRSVVLNLQYLDTEQSQRVVDFLSGATHAIDGHQQRVGQGVFIFVPSNFVLHTESQEARALKDAFWGRSKEKEKEKEHQYQYQYAEPATVKKSSIF